MIVTLEQLSQRLTKGEADDRIEALDDLCAAVRAKHALPLDDVLVLLREHSDDSSGVREALHHAKRAVAVARGNRSHRSKVLAELPADSFEDPDNAFYEGYPRVFELAAAYIRQHPNEFFE